VNLWVSNVLEKTCGFLTEIILPKRFTFNTLKLALKISIREKIPPLEADQAS